MSNWAFTSDEQRELAGLRRENRELRAERRLLKNAVEIAAEFRRHRGCCRAPCVHDEFVAHRKRVGIHRIAREIGSFGRSDVRTTTKATQEDHRFATQLWQRTHLVDQRFVAEQPNTLWIGGISDTRLLPLFSMLSRGV